MLRNARARARRFGVPFNLSASDLVIPKNCPVLGIPLQANRGSGRPRGGGSRTDCSPSLDRIIPAKGYVKGNVMVISWKANRLKNDATADDLLRIGIFLKTLEVTRRCRRAGLSL